MRERERDHCYQETAEHPAHANGDKTTLNARSAVCTIEDVAGLYGNLAKRSRFTQLLTILGPSWLNTRGFVL